MYPGILETLNSWEVSDDENINMLFSAILALIMVLITHEWIEGLLVRDSLVLRHETLQALVLMRSHSSLRKMWALFRGYSWEDGAYHWPNCQCHLIDNPNSTAPSCTPSTRRIPVNKRLFFLTVLVRSVIIIVEVIAIILAINRTTTVYVKFGEIAITPLSNQFGTKISLPQRLGCEAVLPDPKVRTEYLNRIAQLTVCTRLHRPFEAATDVTDAPQGFESFFIYIDISGDKVTLSHGKKQLIGSEMYAYWSIECSDKGKNNTCETVDVPEGAVATVVHGSEYSNDRTGKDTVYKTKERQEEWRRNLDKHLHNEFPNAYRTAYPANATSWVDEEAKRDHPVPRMLLHFNITALQSLHPDEDTRIGLLLQRIVGLQRREGPKANLIRHSDGIRMIQEKQPVLEYRIKQPIIGSVLWAMLLFLAAIVRWILGRLYPNNLYELILNTVGSATDVDVSDTGTDSGTDSSVNNSSRSIASTKFRNQIRFMEQQSPNFDQVLR